MSKLNAQLRIGEKIGFGFGLVGLLFLGVIWQYHQSLQNALTEYRYLLDVFEAKKSFALDIESSVFQTRQAEKTFLLERTEAAVKETEQYIQDIVQATQQLSSVDEAAAQTANKLTALTTIYRQDFQALVQAWREKGLDHNSGLQGRFRDSVHELENLAGQLNSGRLYLLLLQIRRGEKDLGLRREEEYRSKVLGLVDRLRELTAASSLEEQVKQRLLAEAETYRDTFERYAERVLADEDIQGGKGPFRQAAHRIEALLVSHYIPDLESDILQLRRREKDYLLRLDQRYVEMALAVLQKIHGQVDESAIASADKQRFRSLLNKYQQDFLALVEQNGRIDQLTDEMRQAVDSISELVIQNVAAADRSMQQVVDRIHTSTQENARLMLWVVLLATLLGVALAAYLTLKIAHPLRKMAGQLDQLAFEEPINRMPFIPDGRDEVNAMAGSLNTMADHRQRFIDWWKTSIREVEVCEKLEQLTADKTQLKLSKELDREIKEALQEVRTEKAQLRQNSYLEIDRQCDQIVDGSQVLLAENPSGQKWLALNHIRDAAKSIRSHLTIIRQPQG